MNTAVSAKSPVSIPSDAAGFIKLFGLQMKGRGKL